MDHATFHAAFDQFPNPAFLLVKDRWECNPPGEALAIAPEDLFAMSRRGRDSSVCLSDQFYFLSVDPLGDGSQLMTLRPDRFAVDQASSISSQLRRSLGPALYAVEELEETPAIRADTEAVQNLGRVSQRLYQIFRLATQLDWCQPYNPMLSREEPVDLVRFLRRFADDNRAYCHSKSISITFHTRLARLTTLVDTYNLTYLLLTLLSNTLGFATAPGRVTLTLSHRGSQAILTYQDSNPGTPPTLLSNFLWNDPEVLEPGRGLGLGLPIAKRIAAALGGTLIQTGSGSHGVGMALSLPLREDDGKSLRAPVMDRTGGYSMSRILLSNALGTESYTPKLEMENET